MGFADDRTGPTQLVHRPRFDQLLNTEPKREGRQAAPNDRRTFRDIHIECSLDFLADMFCI